MSLSPVHSRGTTVKRRGDSDGCSMGSVIIRKSGTVKLAGVVFSESQGEARTDILAEIVKRTIGWRKERLGVGLPPRR